MPILQSQGFLQSRGQRQICHTPGAQPGEQGEMVRRVVEGMGVCIKSILTGFLSRKFFGGLLLMSYLKITVLIKKENWKEATAEIENYLDTLTHVILRS